MPRKNKHEMFNQDWMSLPYYPQRYSLIPNKRAKLNRYALHIAYTEVMRGDEFEIPTLLFYNAPFPMLKAVCEYFFRIMNGYIRDIRLWQEHSCRYKNGKCYWRVAVQAIGIKESLVSLNEFFNMLVYKIKSTFNCCIRCFKSETFINL